MIDDTEKGFDGCSHTLEEVAHVFKVTRARIREIEDKAIRKMENQSRKWGLADGNNAKRT